ncbi:hypothetical protein BOTBODRAFT_120536 [Botryobasidium botryosum FD-172 SS1]|uniref:DNA 3'-5' helicase n=1 Tax=Botryobasidium botryosum (strain FD-172 SS1) TaxID=930990 RepID=A0A067M666_BOTB1|nr:hypothetical protein BOTBODRAFT_120536 [Botryobasidium botryosum FD-172 SS1]
MSEITPPHPGPAAAVPAPPFHDVSFTEHPSYNEIIYQTHRLFGKKPCMPQVVACDKALRDKHVVFIVRTGFGKTLAFWMPLIWHRKGITFLISPLQSLSDQHDHSKELGVLGIKSIHLTSKNISDKTFKDISQGEYGVIITSPEVINTEPHFEDLWKSPRFCKRVNRIIFDEAHCISEWGDFRPDYKLLCKLIHICRNAKFFLLSATMPALVLSECMRLLQLPRDTEVIHQSNNCPNISIDIRRIKFPQKSLFDLAFLIPFGLMEQSPPPSKFMAFLKSKQLCEKAACFLQARLPTALKKKVVWVHADMSQEFVRAALKALKEGMIWGICCTDVAGMGIDIPNIELIVHYQAAKSLCILFQRFGRGARDMNLTARAILFAEPRHFTDVQEKRKRDAEVHALRKKKGKAQALPESDEIVPRKRLRKDTLPIRGLQSTAPFSPSLLA